MINSNCVLINNKYLFVLLERGQELDVYRGVINEVRKDLRYDKVFDPEEIRYIPKEYFL